MCLGIGFLGISNLHTMTIHRAYEEGRNASRSNFQSHKLLLTVQCIQTFTHLVILNHFTYKRTGSTNPGTNLVSKLLLITLLNFYFTLKNLINPDANFQEASFGTCLNTLLQIRQICQPIYNAPLRELTSQHNQGGVIQVLVLSRDNHVDNASVPLGFGSLKGFLRNRFGLERNGQVLH